MLHVDGSRHRWIPGLDQYQDLIVVFDDATSEVYDVKLVGEESTITVMESLKRVVETRGALHDRSFSVEAEQAGTAFLPYTGTELEKIFSLQYARVVDNDNTVSYDNRCLQIPKQTFRFSMARCPVLACEHLDQTLSVHYAHHVLGRYDAAGRPLELLPVRSTRQRPSGRFHLLPTVRDPHILTRTRAVAGTVDVQRHR